MNYCFDTSFLFALCFEQDVHHAITASSFRDLPNHSDLVINELIFAEFVTLMCYRFDFATAIEKVELLYELGFRIVERSITDYYLFFQESQKSIPLQDVSLVYDCLVLDGILLTYDKQQLALFSQRQEYLGA